MHVTPTSLPDVLILEPPVFADDRGFFLESWNSRVFSEAVGQDVAFVQDNHSRSIAGVLRGLHYQMPQPQGKLVRVVSGAIWDVAVDLRASSPTFKHWVGVDLVAEHHRQLWIPPGFGHGFLTMSPSADVVYKATTYYRPEHDHTIRYNDPDLAIDWPLSNPILSEKDANALALADSVLFP